MTSTTVNPGQVSTDKLERSFELAMAAVRVAAENRGQEILVLDMRPQTALFDYFVIVTGSSGRQLRAIADEIDHELVKKLGDRRLGVDGYKGTNWIVQDYGNVVIHVFDENARDFYRLEDLWADVPRVDITAIVSAAGK